MVEAVSLSGGGETPTQCSERSRKNVADDALLRQVSSRSVRQYCMQLACSVNY